MWSNHELTSDVVDDLGECVVFWSQLEAGLALLQCFIRSSEVQVEELVTSRHNDVPIRAPHKEPMPVQHVHQLV